jgi:hypothetical protein
VNEPTEQKTRPRRWPHWELHSRPGFCRCGNAWPCKELSGITALAALNIAVYRAVLGIKTGTVHSELFDQFVEFIRADERHRLIPVAPDGHAVVSPAQVVAIREAVEDAVASEGGALGIGTLAALAVLDVAIGQDPKQFRYVDG